MRDLVAELATNLAAEAFNFVMRQVDRSQLLNAQQLQHLLLVLVTDTVVAEDNCADTWQVANAANKLLHTGLGET